MNKDEKNLINHVRLWDLENRENLKYLDKHDVSRLVEILKNGDQCDNNCLQELKKLHEKLERELDDKFHKEFDEIKKGMGRLRAHLRDIPGYPNEPDPVLDHIYHVFDEWYGKLEATRLLDTLQNTYHLFKYRIYPELENKLYNLVNPSVFPVNLVEVMDAMPNHSFTTLVELDGLLEEIRNEAIKRLNNPG